MLSPLEIARVAHEINRAYCEATGDSSQQPWDQAPEWQRTSYLDGVSFLIRSPESGPEALHSRWMDLKVAEGWKYGPKKDADKRTHPALVPFRDLPLEQRVKDHLFRAVVLSLRSLGRA